jgi:hypothetical protein
MEQCEKVDRPALIIVLYFWDYVRFRFREKHRSRVCPKSFEEQARIRSILSTNILFRSLCEDQIKVIHLMCHSVVFFSLMV